MRLSYVTVTWCLPGWRVDGTMAATCVAEVYTIKAESLPIRTLVPTSVVPSGYTARIEVSPVQDRNRRSR